MRDASRVAAAIVLTALLSGTLALLARTAAASEAAAVTIGARPTIAGPEHPITLFGTVASGRPGETVDIQTKDCGQSFFRVALSTQTQSGGRWATTFFPGIGTTVRAVWNGRTSALVRVGQRAMLRFAPKAGDRTRFEVAVVARAQFWRRTVVIERLHRQPGAWRAYRSVVLTKQEAPGEFVWTSGEFTARLPNCTSLRAPAAVSGPTVLPHELQPVAAYGLTARLRRRRP